MEIKKTGRVCAQCGKEIDSVKDGFVMCRDNFIQAKYFREMDGSRREKKDPGGQQSSGVPYVVLTVHCLQEILIQEQARMCFHF